MDFTTIDYLKSGNKKQQKSYKLLCDYKIMDVLAVYHPILVGTIPIEIDIDSSDLDIICYTPSTTAFLEQVTLLFGDFDDFKAVQTQHHNLPTIVVNFSLDGLEVELFGQAVPTMSQQAYRHLIIEHRLLQQYGNSFKKQLIALKEQGIKTEPAFAQLLQLAGDPYLALLKLDLL